MSVEGDARPARQSSSPSALLFGFSGRARAFARYAFGGFVLVHFLGQAFRATRDAARPEPGLETQPWFVVAVLLVVWLPFTLLAGQELRAWFVPTSTPENAARDRALAFAERLSLLLVLGFAFAHGAEIAWPLVSGASVAADVRPNLVLLLSSTSHGVPVRAALYVCGVAASSFYATRQVLAAGSTLSRPAARGIVALGVLAYLLGSFAVIRCSGGQIFP